MKVVLMFAICSMRPIFFHAFSFLAWFISIDHAAAQNIIKGSIELNIEVCTYFTLQPKEHIKGIVLLLPGRGESPKQVFKNTKLPTVLAAKGYLTLVPELQYSLFADKKIKSQIAELLKTQSVKHNLINPTLIIGGFSAGGAVAISYAEFLLSDDTTINLKAIFAIDPPLDLERLYAAAERLIKYNCGNLIQRDGTVTKDYLDKAFGGSPTLKPETYLEHSPFAANSSDGGNAKWLRNIPIRLYTEPDLQFVQKKYCKELRIEDLNAGDLEKLNRLLLKIGNRRSEYITTTGKGYHTWNIADPDELVDWIIKNSN